MTERLVIAGLQYTAYFVEFALMAYLVRRGQLRRLAGLSFYVGVLLLVDALGRPLVLYHYGFNSPQFAYVYWLSDAFLELTAFALVCALFRRACANRRKLWESVKLVLGFVFVLVFGVSLFALSNHQSQLLTRFIIEFEQNLYFTCLVLNTLLYILLQQLSSTDEELQLLVCGFGIQFAGSAASYALIHLTPGWVRVTILNDVVAPLCTMGMLLTWFYAVARMPKPARASSTADIALSTAEASAHGS